MKLYFTDLENTGFSVQFSLLLQLASFPFLLVCLHAFSRNCIFQMMMLHYLHVH